MLLASIPNSLIKSSSRRYMTEILPIRCKTLSNQSINQSRVVLLTGFTDDKFLRELCKELDDEWYKVAVLMGWNYSDIERMITENSPSQAELIWHVSQGGGQLREQPLTGM